MSALGVSELHSQQILNYLRFARYQRVQRIKAVDMCFEDLKGSRLSDETYTLDEVNEMLDGLLEVVKSEMEEELINTARTNVLLVRQLFEQAEKWHLKLQADISELENRELLDKIRDFEESQFSGTPRDADWSASKIKLEPVNEGGGAALLQIKVSELEEENNKLKEKISQIETKTIQFQKERTALADRLGKTEEELFSTKAKFAKAAGDNAEIEKLRSQLEKLKDNVDTAGLDEREAARLMEQDLVAAKHELLKVQEMLDTAGKELEKKVYNTTPYKNLKQMMQKKNGQIKDYRRRLAKYEEVDD